MARFDGTAAGANPAGCSNNWDDVDYILRNAKVGNTLIKFPPHHL